MRKGISLFMVLCLAGCLLAGCGEQKGSAGKDDQAESVTLKIAIPWEEQKDTAMVVEAINKKLSTLLPNTKVELLLDGFMADKWELWMSSQKQIDIAHSGYINRLEDEYRKGSYLNLNDLVEQYAPNIKKLMKDYWYSYDNAKVNGELLGIPNIQVYTKETVMLSVPNKLLPYMNTKSLSDEAYSSDKTTERFYQLFTSGLEAAAANGVDVKNTVNSIRLYDVAKRGYHFIGGENSNLCYDNADDVKIIDFYATDEFATYCKYTKLWASKGWISQDILTSETTSGIIITYGYRYMLDETTRTRLSIGNVNSESTYVYLNDPKKDVLSTNIGENATYYSIPFTTQHEARAMKFLDLINSPEGADILNLLSYGIEGTHYEVLDREKGNIKAFEYEGQGSKSVSYGIPNWMSGNMMLMYNVYPYTHEFKEWARDYYTNHLNQAIKHSLYGFSFDTAESNIKLGNVVKNNSEYAKSISCGTVNHTDQLLNELNTKNKTAGLQDIINDFQQQADAFLASKK